MKNLTKTLLALSVTAVSVNALAAQTLEQQVEINHRTAVAAGETSHNNNQWLGQVEKQADAN
ncbi:hypothetical protein, partial [Vibrio breoganii]